MKYPLFLSREEIYNGHYSIKKRDATCEFTRDLHYHGYCISFDSSLLLFACSDTSNLFNIFSSCARSGHVRRLTSGQILDLISICRRYETLSMANGSTKRSFFLRGLYPPQTPGAIPVFTAMLIFTGHSKKSQA